MIKDKYLRNVRPKIQVNGVDLNRQPILNLGAGISASVDDANDRINLNVDGTNLQAVTQFTSSINGVTFYTNTLPRFVDNGTINSGSSVVLSCSLKPNTTGIYFARAVLRNPSNSKPAYASALKVVTNYINGSDPTIEYHAYVDQIYPATSGSMSQSIDVSTDSLNIHFTSSTGSNYTYALFCDGNELAF